jgi:hypothetical protein
MIGASRGDMERSRTVRYFRCEGPGTRQHPPGSDSVLVRIEHEGEQAWFGGYIVLDADNHVIEKSSNYGLYEGEAWDFDKEPECRPASRRDFEAAWNRPYARRSLWRQFLSSLNGADDRARPDDDVIA